MKTKLLLPVLAILLLPLYTSGQIWSHQHSAVSVNLLGIQFLDYNNGYVCGENGTVLKSTDGGDTWQEVNIPTTYSVNDIFFLDVNNGWAAVGDESASGTSGQIWKTTNGGTTWTSQTPSTSEARFGISFASATTGWAVGTRNGPINIDGTSNGGSSWVNQSNSAIYGWLYKVDAISETTAIAIGRTYWPSSAGFVVKTTDGGSTWQQANTVPQPFANAIYMVDSITGFIAAEGGVILATTDGGSSWAIQTSGTSDTLYGVSFVNSSVGWVCGQSATILRTVNGGASWNIEIPGSIQDLYCVFALDSSTVWAAGAEGEIVKRSKGIGISEVKTPDFKVIVSPNPFITQTTISFDPPTGDDSYTIVLTDKIGREVKLITGIKESSISLQDGTLPSGIYHYILLNKRGAVLSSGRLVKTE